MFLFDFHANACSSFNNGCDGSLILADECSNSENAGLGRVCTEIGNLAAAKDVGVADLIQFAAGKPSRYPTPNQTSPS